MVSVVVSDLTECVGLEKVLLSSLRESIPPPMVRLVPARELAPWLGAKDCGVSLSVDAVPAMLLSPAVRGGLPSVDVVAASIDVMLLVRAVVREYELPPFPLWQSVPLVAGTSWPWFWLTWPDCG